MHDQVVIETRAEQSPEGPSTAIEAGDERVVIMEDLLIEEVSIDGMCGVY
jgi:mycofactocin precursor